MGNLDNKNNVNWYYSVDGTIYTGERENIRDIKIPVRPSMFHKFDKANKRWVLDNNEISSYKLMLIDRINNDYKTKIENSTNMSNTDKLAIRDKYDVMINKIKSTTDPIALQEIE